MKLHALMVVLTLAITVPLAAQEPADAALVLATALEDVTQQLHAGPPLNLQHKRDMIELPADAIVVARRTIGGSVKGYRSFVEKFFGTVIAEELIESYGNSGPTPREIEQKTAGPFPVVPLHEFESGAFEYDWLRLNEKYPGVRHVVRLSPPVFDSLGTYAVVRYELIGRDRPSNFPQRPWQHASFVQYIKQKDGSWKQGISRIGAIWD